MITKTYLSIGSTLHINVKLGENNYKHISFDSMSNGNSVYRTANEAIQDALERHSYFGKSFNVINVEDSEKVEEVKPVEVTKTKDNTVTVTDLDDAKNYLVEHYELSRTKLRSKKAILEAAEAHGVVFVGLE